MYQLIYTSAPRLLEAGKTGFGTVARSRELPQPLVAYLERISSYDRAENIGSFLYYSVYTMGGLVYHIFSRIADCGVDYTKRTNHIAHHWVMPDDEMGQPHHRGNTPAGVLLALQQSWQPSWQKLPQWFTGDIQVELPYPEMGRTWEKLTGQQDNQRWLNESDIQQGINLLLPVACNETDTLKLLHEAFLNRKDHGWGMGFTTAATSTINRKNYPLFCITQTQQEHGHSYLTGYQSIRVDHTLRPPVATPSQPVPAASVETNYQPAGAFPGNAFLPQQTAPPPLTPVPMPAMPGVMPVAPLQPEKTAYPDFSSSERTNPLISVCYAVIGAIVILGILGGAYWYMVGTTKTSPAITENHKKQSKKKASDTETHESQTQQGKPISDSSTKQEQAIPSPPAEQQKQENIPTPTEQQEQTPPALVEPQKQPEAPTPTEQQGQTPPASAEQQPDISPAVSEEYGSEQDSNESTGEPKEFSISIRELQNVEITVEFNKNTGEFDITVADIQVPLQVLEKKLPQYHTFYHIHNNREQWIQGDCPAKIIDGKKKYPQKASSALQGAYEKYQDAKLQYDNAKIECNSLQDAMKSSSSTSRSRQQRERRVSKVQKNKEVSNSKAAEQRLTNQRKQCSAAQKKLEEAENGYNSLREKEEKELKKQWAKKCIVKFTAEEAPNDTSEVRIKTEFCISE